MLDSDSISATSYVSKASCELLVLSMLIVLPPDNPNTHHRSLALNSHVLLQVIVHALPFHTQGTDRKNFTADISPERCIQE